MPLPFETYIHPMCTFVHSGLAVLRHMYTWIHVHTLVLSHHHTYQHDTLMFSHLNAFTDTQTPPPPTLKHVSTGCTNVDVHPAYVRTRSHAHAHIRKHTDTHKQTCTQTQAT